MSHKYKWDATFYGRDDRAAVLEALEMILILDNADTQGAASGVEETLPKLQGGEVIITSRVAEDKGALRGRVLPP